MKLIPILFLALATALLADPLPSEKLVLIVGKSHSMSAVMLPGDTAIVDTAFPYEKLRVNDIVYIASGVIHRISERWGPLFYTKGDANFERDAAPLGTANYSGKVTGVIHKDGTVDRY